MKKFILLLSCAALVYAPIAQSCSAFRIPSDSKSIMGKSYDWYFGHGHMLVNKKNVEKESLLLDIKGKRGAKWTSKYGSVTFNQHGREFPLGGINERGLGIEILWLSTSIYEEEDGRPVLNELQWIQRSLDIYSSVEEVIAGASEVRLEPVAADIHYFVCDSYGECATFEYLDGKMVIHSGDTMPVQAITNSTYEDSYAHAKLYKPFGGKLDVEYRGYNPLHRFVRVGYVPQTRMRDEGDFDLGFRTLDTVRGGNSQWNIMYDLKNLKISFKILMLGPKEGRRTVDLSKMNFSCKTKVQYFDLEQRGDGPVFARLKDYSASENRRLVMRSVGEDLPPELTDAIANYSDTTTCRE